MAELQRKVVDDIPKQARRVFLEDQITALSDSIGLSYQRYKDLLDELNTNIQSENLPVSLRQAVEQNVMPSYLEKQRKQEFIYWGIGITLVFTILPLFLSIMLSQFDERIEIFGFDFLIGWIWEIALLLILLTFLFSNVLARSSRFQRPKLVAVIFWWLFSLAFFGFIFLVSTSWVHLKDPPSNLIILLVFLSATAPLAFSIFLTSRYLRNHFVQRREVNP